MLLWPNGWRQLPAKQFYAGSSPVGSSIKNKEVKMPVKKLGANKYRWGQKGKIYPTKAQALRQGRAIIISQKKAGKKVK